MMASGFRGSSMEMAFGRATRETATSANGLKIWHTGLASINGKTGTVMKVNGSKV
jgi:hypothetical protein